MLSLNQCKNRGTYHHGMCSTAFYGKWRSMLQRCRDKGHHKFPSYGGRGIAVCGEWLRFEYFFRDLYDSYCVHVSKFGERNTTLERIDNDGPYEAQNVRWATFAEQSRNKRNNVYGTFQGRTQTLSDWAKEMGIKRTTLHMRVRVYGWSIERALTE